MSLVTVFGVGHFFGRFLAVNGQPTRLYQDLAFRLEMVGGGSCLDFGDARGDLVFSAGVEHRHEAAHHQVIYLLLRFGQSAGDLQCRDDGEVITDLGIVKDAFAGFDVLIF